MRMAVAVEQYGRGGAASPPQPRRARGAAWRPWAVRRAAPGRVACRAFRHARPPAGRVRRRAAACGCGRLRGRPRRRCRCARRRRGAFIQASTPSAGAGGPASTTARMPPCPRVDNHPAAAASTPPRRWSARSRAPHRRRAAMRGRRSCVRAAAALLVGATALAAPPAAVGVPLPSPVGWRRPPLPPPCSTAGGLPSLTTRHVHLPIKGAHVIWVTFLTLLPWTIVAVFDAIDHTLRRRSVVALRLGVSTTCIAVAYAVGTWYVVELVALSPRDGRWDECATVLVAMFFNLYVGRRGLGVGVGIGVGVPIPRVVVGARPPRWAGPPVSVYKGVADSGSLPPFSLFAPDDARMRHTGLVRSCRSFPLSLRTGGSSHATSAAGRNSPPCGASTPTLAASSTTFSCLFPTSRTAGRRPPSGRRCSRSHSPPSASRLRSLTTMSRRQRRGSTPLRPPPARGPLPFGARGGPKTPPGARR